MGIIALVEFSRRHAALLTAVFLTLAFGASVHVARHFSIDSDTEKLVDPDLPWHKAVEELDRLFPQNENLLVVVIDGLTAEQSADAAETIAGALEGMPELFQYVRRPDAPAYFKRNGLLFLSRGEVQDFADHIISAQPFLGTLAADPSVRGVVNAVDLLAVGVLEGEVAPARIDPTLAELAAAVEAAAAGLPRPLSWQKLFSGREPDTGDRRRFVLARAVLDHRQVGAASRAIAAVREVARDAGFVEGSGVSVRITGPVALNNDQLSALSEGAGLTMSLCLGLLCFWLVVGLRSGRAVAAVLVTLVVGLVFCAFFAVVAVGPFNPVSIAFAPLFAGLAVDFGIQFTVRYSAERVAAAPAVAFRSTAAGLGAPLAMAAVATGAGFLAFTPTTYLGVRDLGLISGAGMMIALALNLTLLPALLSLLRVPGNREMVGFSWGAAADRMLSRRRRRVIATGVVLAAGFAAALPWLRFDFNPVNLQNPRSESVMTLHDLMGDPLTSPYSIEFLAERQVAEADAARLRKLPEVARVLSLDIFVPGDQEAKLAIVEDAAALLGPTLSPAVAEPPPLADEVLEAVARCGDHLAQWEAPGGSPAARLAAALREIVRQGEAALPALRRNLGAGIDRRLEELRELLQAGPVSLDSLPPEFRRDWQAADGRWRVEVFPNGDMRENEALRHFARVVRGVAPHAAGSAISVEEWTLLAPRTFATAGGLALVTISLLLLAVLRRPGEVVLVLAPLVLAGLFTLGAAAMLGFPINFANILTLPMMLGIGTAFNIYFVMRRRANEPGLLASPTARGMTFSALTTGTAFGSLALSSSPGMAEMGKFLSLALGFILVCTAAILPAFCGNPSRPSVTPATRDLKRPPSQPQTLSHD